MLLAAEMLEEKIYYQTHKLNNNESSESGGTAEETSDRSYWQKHEGHNLLIKIFYCHQNQGSGLQLVITSSSFTEYWLVSDIEICLSLKSSEWS